jgi:hypothetical protein
VDDLEKVFFALQQCGARYLVVGGVAVVLHGHPRFTADLDLVLSLEPTNLRNALDALKVLGYRPRAPVAVDEFVDPEIRRSWIEEKGLTVFSLWSAQLPLTEIDVFVEEPFPFEATYARALRADLGFGIVTVASIDDLIDLKTRAGRPKDLEDVRVLRQLKGGPNG